MSDTPGNPDPLHFEELRLFVEEVCDHIFRFESVEKYGLQPQDIDIDQEVYLGGPGAFADIRVQVPNQPITFIEVKYGYDTERLVSSITRKYGEETPGSKQGARVVLVADTYRHSDWDLIEARIREQMRPELELEVWDEQHLLSRMAERFPIHISSFQGHTIRDLRNVIDKAFGRYAFGKDYKPDEIHTTLIWHFGYWRVRNMIEKGFIGTGKLVDVGRHKNIAVMLADLSNFSSYVRDTPDDHVVRGCLANFYAKARHQIINSGGMLYQFLGDAVIALFGLTDPDSNHLDDAMDCAEAMVEIGSSVCDLWQRQIDRVQRSGGTHIGMAIGNLHVVQLQPFSPTRISAIGDAINITARLLDEAGPGEIVASNSLVQRLSPHWQNQFRELSPIEARNMGLIKTWKLPLGRNRNLPGSHYD
jgi:class 3 adenylate cyclase